MYSRAGARREEGASGSILYALPIPFQLGQRDLLLTVTDPEKHPAYAALLDRHDGGVQVDRPVLVAVAGDRAKPGKHAHPVVIDVIRAGQNGITTRIDSGMVNRPAGGSLTGSSHSTRSRMFRRFQYCTAGVDHRQLPG